MQSLRRTSWRQRWQRMIDPASLGAKLVVILTAIGLGGAIGITLLLAVIITPSFNRLEGKAIAGHVERTDAALAEFAGKAESAVRDYGDWNDSYDYMALPNARFERDSFSPLAMSNLGIQGMAYVAPDRHVVIARWRDVPSGIDRPALRAALIAHITRSDMARLLAGHSSAHYYARLNGTLAAIGVAQVRRSDGTGSPRGWVMMARQITSAQLSGLLQLNAHIVPVGNSAGEMITNGRTMSTIAVPIRGADGRPVAVARFTVPRDVSMLGRRMLLLAVAGSTLLLLLLLLVLRRMIARLVLRPLARVEEHMQRVRASGSLAMLDDDRRRDEIGSLGRSLNAMLRQLYDLREQIEVQSFALGRTESAVAVMHNVRNALNPVSTILSQGAVQAPAIDRAMLDRALAELVAGDAAPARRQKLIAFVAAAIDAEGEAREAMRRDLGIGREAMAHVMEIIGEQQQKAHERPVLEICDVSAIVARNATIARYSDMASVAFSFPAVRHLAMANRVILSQVIGNLLGNAAEAIAATGRSSGSITVSIVEQDGRVEVHIRDDGEGFTAEVGETLFQRGFSTRRNKSGGLGLHWCANSMTAMEGSLRLESEGKNRGAVVILTLGAADPSALANAA